MIAAHTVPVSSQSFVFSDADLDESGQLDFDEFKAFVADSHSGAAPSNDAYSKLP